MYEKKEIEYFTHTRFDIVNALNGRRYESVLEVGAGGCDTLLYLKSNKLAEKVTGIELFELKDSNQKNSLIDTFIQADLEHLPQLNLPKEHFDLIICADVLEHLNDPWKALKDLKTLLKKDGHLVCSMPNFREIKTLYQISIKGDFKYSVEGGILDITHLRFFCKKNIVSLFQSSGFVVEDIKPSFIYNKKDKNRRLINALTFGLFQNFLAFQYILKAHA